MTTTATAPSRETAVLHVGHLHYATEKAVVVGLIYAMLGALAGAAVGKLGATYLLLFGAMLDLGIVQNPMFGSGEPTAWSVHLDAFA